MHYIRYDYLFEVESILLNQSPYMHTEQLRVVKLFLLPYKFSGIMENMLLLMNLRVIFGQGRISLNLLDAKRRMIRLCLQQHV